MLIALPAPASSNRAVFIFCALSGAGRFQLSAYAHQVVGVLVKHVNCGLSGFLFLVQRGLAVDERCVLAGHRVKFRVAGGFYGLLGLAFALGGGTAHGVNRRVRHGHFPLLRFPGESLAVFLVFLGHVDGNIVKNTGGFQKAVSYFLIAGFEFGRRNAVVFKIGPGCVKGGLIALSGLAGGRGMGKSANLKTLNKNLTKKVLSGSRDTLKKGIKYYVSQTKFAYEEHLLIPIRNSWIASTLGQTGKEIMGR